MKKMIYLTYAEPPSGVFSSQVVDVINYMNSQFTIHNSQLKENAEGKIQNAELKGKDFLRLVSFISLHDFKKNKINIQKQFPGAIVLPMLPKATYWRFNVIFLWMICLIIRPKAIIARNVIAANMALKVRGISGVKKVCFDGRGAIAAEWKEYDVKVVESWKKEIDALERKAVNESDYRIAVTEKLVEYWNDVYAYRESAHVVIPCTLNSNFKAKTPTVAEISESRKKLGLNENDLVLAYSGSTAGWQSFSILYPYLSHYLKSGLNYKVVFLAPEEENIKKLQSEFPQQIFRKWVSHNEVPGILTACDMGILIREQSVTNKVASPTKFAEYLSVGLPVIITENLGDYSAFVKEHQCGYVVDGSQYPQLETSTVEKRTKMIELVQQYCTKTAFKNQYLELINTLSK